MLKQNRYAFLKDIYTRYEKFAHKYSDLFLEARKANDLPGPPPIVEPVHPVIAEYLALLPITDKDVLALTLEGLIDTLTSSTGLSNDSELERARCVGLARIYSLYMTVLYELLGADSDITDVVWRVLDCKSAHGIECIVNQYCASINNTVYMLAMQSVNGIEPMDEEGNKALKEHFDKIPPGYFITISDGVVAVNDDPSGITQCTGVPLQEFIDYMLANGKPQDDIEPTDMSSIGLTIMTTGTKCNIVYASPQVICTKSTKIDILPI